MNNRDILSPADREQTSLILNGGVARREEKVWFLIGNLRENMGKHENN